MLPDARRQSPEEVNRIRRLHIANEARERLQELGFYHSFRFADGSEVPGAMPLEHLAYRYGKFPLPTDLTGKRVLDIGAWDGWFSFEAERRGAEVTAIDNVELATFWAVHQKLQSAVKFHELDLFELGCAGLGKFDYVFFLGVLYHVKHPLLALELVCAATLDMAIVESYVTDSEDWTEHRERIPTLEFYERDELGGQLDNWFGPTVACLMGMCRTAGFARVEVLHAENSRASLACYRHWETGPVQLDAPVPRISYVVNNRRHGINFRAARDEYISWYFEYPGETPNHAEIRFEAGGLGVAAMYATAVSENFHLAMSRLPPGLDAGWHTLRMSVGQSDWSNAVRIAVDLASHSDGIEINLVCDGATWARYAVELTSGPAYLVCWLYGLTETADEANVTLLVDGRKIAVDFVGKPEEMGRQVNGKLPADLIDGAHLLLARFGGAESKPVEFLVRRRNDSGVVPDNSQ